MIHDVCNPVHVRPYGMGRPTGTSWDVETTPSDVESDEIDEIERRRVTATHNISVEARHGSHDALVHQPEIVYQQEMPGRHEPGLNIEFNHYHLFSHIEDKIKEKIVLGKYVELATLISEDKLMDDEDSMQLVNRDGVGHFVPSSKQNLKKIESFGKWEQAFRVYQGIYSQEQLNWSNIHIVSLTHPKALHGAKYPIMTGNLEGSWGWCLRENGDLLITNCGYLS